MTLDRAPRRNVILVGASAGGIEALIRLLGGLDPQIGAAVGITLHRGSFSGTLGPVLGRSARIPVREARDGERFLPGRAYVAPGDRHMLFANGCICLDRGPKEHHTRPAVDPMLRSGATEFGARVIGVVLTGNLTDGVTGLVHVKHHGGLSVVQDPAEAPFPSMPEAALRCDHVDVVATLDAMPRVLAGLVRGEGVAKAVLDAEGARTTRARKGRRGA